MTAPVTVDVGAKAISKFADFRTASPLTAPLSITMSPVSDKRLPDLWRDFWLAEYWSEVTR